MIQDFFLSADSTLALTFIILPVGIILHTRFICIHFQKCFNNSRNIVRFSI